MRNLIMNFVMKKYSRPLEKLGHVQDGGLYIFTGSLLEPDPLKGIAEQPKNFMNYFTFLCYSNAKSPLKVSLLFNRVEKTKLENLDLVHLLSFSLLLSKQSSKS